jgi:hypothetical protein
VTTLTKRPQTAIIAKAARYVSEKRAREVAAAKARADGLNKWERAKPENDEVTK